MQSLQLFLSVCRPPEVVVSLEFSEYNVNENIRNSNFALLACVVATDVAFQSSIVVEAINGTAQGLYANNILYMYYTNMGMI